MSRAHMIIRSMVNWTCIEQKDLIKYYKVSKNDGAPMYELERGS